MRAVWLRVRRGLRQDWRTPAGLMLVVALMGAVVLVSLAGARRTDTAVARFVEYSGPTEGEVGASPAVMRTVAGLPGVAWTQRGALMFALPYAGNRPYSQVGTWAIIDRPAQSRPILVAGRLADPARPGEAMINESAARVMHARVGSVIGLRGYRPSQAQQVLAGANLPPRVVLPAVRVTGILRLPRDLITNQDVPADVSYAGTASLFLTGALYRQISATVANNAGLAFHLDRGQAGLPAFEAEVRAVTHGRAHVSAGSDDAVAAASAERGTTLQALALALFGALVAVSLLVIVAQGLTRLAFASSTDFGALHALGCSRGQLFAVALVPAVLICGTGLVLAIPVAWLLSGLTPIGLARQAEVSPGLSFDAGIMLGGAAVLIAALTLRAALTAWRVVLLRVRAHPAGAQNPGSRRPVGGQAPVATAGGGRAAAGVRTRPGSHRGPGPPGGDRDRGVAGGGDRGADLRHQPGPADHRPGGDRVDLDRRGRQPAFRRRQRADRARPAR